MIEICEYKHSDLAELYSLISTTIKSCYPAIYRPEVVDFFIDYHSMKEIEDRSKNATIIILRENYKLIGSGFLSGSELGGVYVHPDCQGKGYGKMIVQHIIQIAKNKNIYKIHLDSTPIARKMYEKLCFRVTEEAVQMVGDVPLDYFKMEKVL